MKLQRLTDQPILTPNPSHTWEAAAVFNAAVAKDNNLIHMLYRATDKACKAFSCEEKYVSSIGYAVSHDGISFYRFDKPVFQGGGPEEAWGCEDPRITQIGDEFYMVYTAFGGFASHDNFRLAMASTRNFVQWERKGIVLDEANKDGALFPEKIGGRYFMLHRRPPAIWLADSDSLTNWGNHRKLVDIKPNSWMSSRIGAGAPPIKTDQGWLIIFHGVDENNIYRLGAALLDINDPGKVLSIYPDPILEPELPWEKEGFVPNVVFSCGAADMGDSYYVYYGAADTVIGVASIKKSEIDFGL